jgi:hypothetical protein
MGMVGKQGPQPGPELSTGGKGWGNFNGRFPETSVKAAALECGSQVS